MVPFLLSIATIVASVYLLNIITEEFFAVALDVISNEKLNLPSSVAGASLMAMGSSAPELCIALIAVFQDGGSHASLGIGTIVGSAVFNILVITGVSAIVRPARARLTVVLRDAAVYLVAVGTLIYVIHDSNVTIVEASMLLAIYAGYLILLFTWKQDELQDEPEDDEADHDSILARILRVFTGDPEKNAIWTFFLSIVLIGGICFALVEAAIVFADFLKIPSLIVGLTILAAATSVPDMISSMVAAKSGRGEMAIANAVGSNIFDILIGLGLPWLLALTIRKTDVSVGTEGLIESTVILIGTVFLMVGLLAMGRVLSRGNGLILLTAYVAYVVWVWVSTGGAAT